MRQAGFLPFAQRFATKLPWVWTTGLTAPTTYTTAAISYRLNSPYDPDVGIGGNSARQFSALAGIYGKYVVTRANVVLRFSNSNADSHFVGYSVRRSNQTVRSGLIDRQVMVLENSALSPMMSTDKQEVVFRFSVPIGVPWGIKQERLYDESAYQSATTADPANQVILDVLTYDTSATASNSYVSIAIQYETEFFEQIQS